MAERRSSSRLRQSSLVLLRPEESGKGPPERGWLVDVSDGGVALEAPSGHGLEPETLVMIELPLGTSSSRLKTRCRVVGVSGDESEVVHMEFLDESDLFRETLSRSIEAWEQRDEATGRFRGEWW